MALNLAAVPQNSVQQIATKRQFPRQLVGDLTLDHEKVQHRHKILLSRNMTRVLAFHEKERARRSDPVGRLATRQSGPYLGQLATNGVPGLNGMSVESMFQLDSVNSASERMLVEDHYDTSKPEMESMSKDCLKVKTQMESFDTPKRRSLRRQLVNQHEDQDAQLNLELLNIRKKLNFKETAGEGENRPRKRTKRDVIQCHCLLTIWDNRQGLDPKEPIVRKSELCEVVTASGDEGTITADIRLEKPFALTSRELRVAVDSAAGATLGLSDNYFLEIKIIPAKENVQWPPIPILGKSEGDQSTNLGQLAAEKLQGSLVMRYLHLPQAPAQDVPLSVFFLKDGKTYRSKYGLEVRSSWTKGPPEENVVSIKDEGIGLWAVDEDEQPFGRRQPARSKPSSVKSITTPRSQPKVIYNVDPVGAREAREFRRATLKGFQCPACPSQSFDEVKQLQHHFITFHSKYKFIVEKEVHAPDTEELTSIAFKVTAASNPKPRNSDREKRVQDNSWVWQAPSEPFDINAFVEGDPKWIPDQPKKKTSANSTAANLIQDPSSILRARYGGFLPVEHVFPFRDAFRKKYPSIKLNTMTEEKSIPYTSVSHRQRHVSEDPQSETDDEMDNRPFVAKSMESLDVIAAKNSWTTEDRLVRRKWNRARFDEQLSHPRYLSDCLIRFVRAEKEWLAGGDIRIKLALGRLLRDLLMRRVINDEVTRDVWLILHDSDHVGADTMRDVQDLKDTSMRGNDLRNSTGPFRTSSTRQEVVEALLALPESCCGICTENILDVDVRGIPCSQLSCEAPGVWYHARCARCKIKDKTGWKCPLCYTSAADSEPQQARQESL